MSLRIRVFLCAVVLLAMALTSSMALGATVTWDGGGGDGDWSNNLNWDTNTVPNSTDDVVISNVGGGANLLVSVTVNSITVQDDGSLDVFPGQVLTLTSASTIDSGGILTIDGTLSGTGALTVNGEFWVIDGTVNGSGSLTINMGGKMFTVATSVSPVISRTTSNAGTLTLHASSTQDTTFNGTTLTNTGTIDIRNAQDLVPGLGSPTLANAGGLIKKTIDAGTVAINFPVDNAAGATIQVLSGNLHLNGGGTVSGIYDIGFGRELVLGAGTFTAAGTPTVTGSGTLLIDGATFDAGSGVDLTVLNLTLATGKITGSGAVRVSGDFQWAGGTISGSGPRVLNDTSAVLISCSVGNCLLNGGSLTIQASGAYTASSNALTLSNGATLTIDPGESLDVTNDGDFVDGGGAPSSIVVGGSPMAGTIHKTAGAGTTLISVPMTLSGALDVDSGTLQLTAGVSIDPGATLDYDPGAVLDIAGGVAAFGGAVSTPQTGDLRVSGTGTLRVPTSVTVTLPNVTLQGNGVIDGGGTLILTGTSTWSGGTMGSAAAPGGITQVNAGSTLNVTVVSTSTLTQNRILRNNGTLDLPPNGTISLTGSATIENNGMMAKNSGATGISIGPRVENNSGGTLSVVAGTVGLSGGGNFAGAISLSSGDLTLSSGTFTVASTATVTGTGTLGITAGTLDAGAGADLTCPNLSLIAGMISGPGAVRVSGNFTWQGGIITGSGPRVLNNTSTPAISCSVGPCQLNGASLQLQASGTFSAVANALTFSNGGSLTIDAGKTLSITNDGDFTSSVGSGSITNNGTLWKNTTPGVTLMSVPVTMSSTSTVDVDTGSLRFTKDTGVDGGATLDIAIGAGLEIAGGVFLFNSGSVSMPGGGSVLINGGTLRVPTGVTMTIPELTLGSGTIDGGGTLILSGTSSWIGGTMGSAAAPGGVTQIDSGNTLNILGSSGPQSLTQSRILLNNGTLTYAGSGANTLSMSGGTKITNNGTFNLTNNSVIDNSPAGSSIIENNGTFARSAGTGGSTLYPRVENYSGGTVSAITGTSIDFYGGGLASGAYSIASGATFTLAAGTFTVTSTATVTGAGTLTVSGATFTAGSGVDLTVPNLTLASGTINGVGAVRVSGNFTWSGGTITGSGPRVLNSGSTPVISCSVGACQLDGAALQLQASATFSASVNVLMFSNAASLTIDPGTTFSITNSGDFVPLTVSGAGTITNNGTIWKNTGAGVSVVSLPTTLSATSTVDIDNGTLQFMADASVDAGATLDIAAAGTLAVGSGTFLFNSGSVSMPGSGTVQITGGRLRVPASITMTVPNVTLSGGTVDGGGTLILSGTSSWSSGSMGSMSPSGGVTQIDSGSTLNLTGTGTLVQGRILRNNGTFNLPSSGAIVQLGSLTTIENNASIARNSGSGTITIVPRVENNSGATLTVATGTVALIGSGIAAGTYDVASGATLTLGSGTFTVNSTAAVTGAGTLSVAGAQVNAGAGVDLTFPNLTLSSGLIFGPGAVRVSGSFNWSGGAIGGSGLRVLNSTSTPAISCSAGNCILNGATLQLQATATTYSASSNALALASGSSLILDPGQVLFVTNDGDFLNGGGAASSIVIGVNGRIEKTTTSGISTIAVPVTMAGSLKVGAGTLQVSAGVTANAGAIVHYDPGTTFEVTGGVFLFNSNSVSFPANGTFNVSAGTLRVPAGVSLAVPNVTLQGGTVDGDGTLSLNGTSTWSGGTMSGNGTTVVPASQNLAITSPVTLDRLLQNDGTLSVSGNVTGSGTIANNGTLNALGNLSIGTALNNSGQIATSAALSLTAGGTHTGSFTTSAPGTLAFSAGTHVLSGGGSIGGTGTLTFNGAAATVGVPVNVGAMNVSAGTATLNASASADAFSMTGGTLGGSGTLTLNNGGTWSGGTMSGSGTTAIPAAKTLSISSPVTLNSRVLQNDGTLTVSGDVLGSGTIANNGTLNALGNLTIGAALNNSGQIATSAALSLAGGGTHSGAFTTTAPGTLSFSSGTHSLSGGGSIGGTGTLMFNGAAATVGVPVNVGAMNVSAGTATLNASASTDAFSMTGGTLGGTATLTLNNGGTWSGGTMSGSGQTLNPATKTLALSGAVTLSGRTLQNDGAMNVTGNVAGSGTIANNGTLSAATNATIGTALNNSGQIATTGLLSLGGNGAHSGTFTATAPGLIDFSGGTQTISGTVAGTGSLRFSGATVTVSGTWSGMPIEVTGGVAALDTNGTIPALTLSGGTLGGSGEIAVTGPSVWSGGALGGSGSVTFGSGATVTMSGASDATLSRPLVNEGTIDFAGASNGLFIAGVAVRNDGTFNIASSQAISATAGTPPFVNAGTLRKSNGSGVMQFGAPLANSGTVRLEKGTMHFSRGYAQSAGTTNVLAGATLQTATLSLGGGSLTGNGTIAATVDNSATLSPGSSPGTLVINGDYVQSPNGTLEIQLAGTAPSAYDRLLVSGSVTLGGTLDVTAINGFTVAPGNAFQILTFGSRPGNSTFAVVNGLTGSGAALVPAFGTNDLQLTTNLIAAADVAVAATGPGSTIAGTKVIYSITVTNSGPDTATNIVVTVTPSSDLTFSANSGACAGSFPCNIASLGSGQSATIFSEWNIAPSATGSVQLTVSASATADANSANNSASVSTAIGTCPAIVIVAPDEMTTGATAAASVVHFEGATYRWSITGGVIDSDNGIGGIAFTAGEAGTATLTVNVTDGACELSATIPITVKPPPRCVGTAEPTEPADGTVIAGGTVDFRWTAIAAASGYRLWLEQDGMPPRSLGTTLDPSRTESVPPGAYRWFVETLFDGCASHESARRTLTLLPAADCATRRAPELSAPANDTPVASAAVAFSWAAVAQALEYELWLAPAGGVPTLIRTTSDTSYTAVVPPGRLEWYVRAVFAGCAATESAHRVFTYTPPAQCTSERPLLIAPAEGERLTSPVSFEWTRVSGATSYELYIDGVLAATTASPQAANLPVALAERRWQVRARLGEGCGAVASAESRMVVISPPPGCAPLGAPIISAPTQISSGVAGRIQWSFVAGATAYVVETSTDPGFSRESTAISTVTTTQLPFTFTNDSSAPAARYVRVHAVDTNCVQPRTGAFSPVAEVSVLPPAESAAGSAGTALLSDPTDVQYTLTIGAELAGRSFTATPTVPWVSVTPASGIVPPGGQTLLAVAHTAGLPPGTSMGIVEIVTTDAAGGVTALGTLPVSIPIPINNIPGVVTAPKSTPPPDALIIPAVASVTNFIVSYQSDVCVTNTSAQVVKYEIAFVPTGQAGMSEGQKTNVSLEPGATMAINNIVTTWFGGRSSTGTLEIRPLTEIDTSTSSAPVGGLANRTTFASSRTFSTTPGGGTYGQYIPAVPYANFVAKGSTLSLQHVAQSDNYRTNLGLVEGSGEKVSLEVRIFDAAGTKRAAFNVDLNGGERAQLNGVLSEHGIAVDDGRIEVEVMSGDGKVTAYASVLDNITNDPQFVPPVTLDHAGQTKWVVPGVADLPSGSGSWQTDVQIFNAATEATELTLAFYSMNGGPATTRTLALAPGEVRQLDRVLSSFFAISGDAGALHISSAAPARIITTARTYKQTAEGAYGQFIAAVTPEEAVTTGSRPLQLLQMEESERFRSNIGFAEVSGKPVTLEVTVFRPNSSEPAVLEVTLEANQFRQLNSLLASLGLGQMFNARISVRAVGGEGRALAYGSLIDHKTGDPTYIPAQ